MSPQFVVPYRKSNKNGVNDADAIVEASSRPTMRFVGLKSVAQQHVQQVHRARRMAVRNRTAQANEIHGFLLEYGIESSGGRCCRGWPKCWRMPRTNSRTRGARCCGSSGTSIGGWTRASGSLTRRSLGSRRVIPPVSG